MGSRLLVTGAGTSASENLVRSLRRSDPEVCLVGCNDDRFVLRSSSVDRRYLVPTLSGPGSAEALRWVIEAESVDLVIPTSDADVRAISRLRAVLPTRCFLPPDDVIQLCQDKLELTQRLRAAGIPSPETFAVTGLEQLDRLFARFGGRSPLWCRPRTGTSARGGGPVHDPEEARRWIRVWEAMRGIPPTSFTLSAYLSGREILCQSLWRDGTLILINTFERLACFGAEGVPSGVTSPSALAKTAVAPRVVELCRAAVRAVAPAASGAFSIDVKEDEYGAPHITEINAGRLFMAMTAFDPVLKHNMPATYVRLGLGEPVDLCDEYDVVEDYYLVRDLDTLPAVFHADELFEGILTPGSGGRGP
jgi:carbamoyl-phosphate synthase large subunit